MELLPPDGDFWTRWHRHYERLGIGDGYCLDGVADTARFDSASRKVLFVLKEPNKWGGLADMRGQLRKGPEYLIWHNVARWAVGLLDEFPSFELADTLDLKREALASVAVVNLKKATGKAAADSTVLNAYAYRDRKLLREQINTIDPEVIIACGAGVFGPLLWLLKLDPHRERPLDKAAWDAERDCTVVPWLHPAARRKKRELYEKLRELMGTATNHETP